MKRILLLVALGTALAGCASRSSVNGNLVTDERLARIEAGNSNTDDVLYTLGSPSAVGTFDQSTWYYVGEAASEYAFLGRDVDRRRIIEIRFDETGIVQSMAELTEEDGQDVDFVSRKTPTLGRQITAFEQLLGNVGRFNN